VQINLPFKESVFIDESKMFLKPPSHSVSILSLHIDITVSIINLTIIVGYVKGHLIYFVATLEV